MRVTIEHREKTTGLFSKTTRYEVALAVQFSAEELATIKKLAWKDAIILERKPVGSQVHKFSADELRQLANTFALKVSTLLKGEDVYTLDTPGEAQEYEDQLKDTLHNFKANFERNAVAPKGKQTFEL